MRVSQAAEEAIGDSEAFVAVSAATAWELAIKWRAGHIKLPQPPQTWMPAAMESGGFNLLAITLDHALAVADLPSHHTDPFDRLLIAQARLEALTIVTADTAFEDYEVTLLDARA